MSQYNRPADNFETELIIKNSRFITYIAHTPDNQSSDQFIDSIRQLHPGANHNCWARITGAPGDGRFWSCSDDGEPKGTAGRPMLTVLEHSGIGEITAVVTRYFGGIKLGTGGLVRAYGQSVNEALAILPLELVVAREKIHLKASFSLTGTVEHLLSRFEVSVLERDWSDCLNIEGEIDSDKLAELQQAIAPYGDQLQLLNEE